MAADGGGRRERRVAVVRPLVVGSGAQNAAGWNGRVPDAAVKSPVLRAWWLLLC